MSIASGPASAVPVTVHVWCAECGIVTVLFVGLALPMESPYTRNVVGVEPSAVIVMPFCRPIRDLLCLVAARLWTDSSAKGLPSCFAGPGALVVRRGAGRLTF